MPQKSREKWTGLPQQPIEVTAETLARLEGAIREYYQRLDGRGEACHVEYRRRSGAIDSFFAYPADYVDDVEEYETMASSSASAGAADSKLLSR